MDDKIYSRKRLLISNKQNRNANFNNQISAIKNKRFGIRDKNLFYNNGKLIRTFLIVIIAVCIANRIISAISPTMDVLCVNLAKSVATKISNEQAKIVMSSYKYEDIVNIVRDDTGNIKVIEMNVSAVNEITSNIAIKIQEGFDNYERGEYYIRLGTFTGTKILSGRGPKVPIKMSMVGNVETNLISNFSEAGINQTLHRVYLKVDCSATILTPFDTIEEDITNQVLLAEAVIVGEVPDTYYHLEGIEDSDLLEVVE